MSAGAASLSDDLTKFEAYADGEVAKLSFWRLPIRSLLSAIYLSADSQYVGERFSRSGPRNDEVGTAILTRMSYVIGFFKTCTRDVGADIDNALSVFDQGLRAEFEHLLGYAHFCEVMPLVRRGFLTATTGSSGFALEHPNEQFMRHEEIDILMSEMALAHDLVPPPYPIERYERMVKAWPTIPADDLVTVLKEAHEHYLANVFELPLLSDAAFSKSFDFTRADFVRVRAALMAYADFCLGMADAAERLAARAVTRPRRLTLEREVREWAAPLLNRNHIIGLAAGVAAVDLDVAERIVNIFSLDFNNLEKSGGGEGFFPPFLILDNFLLFSPHAVKRMMPERNLLYSTLRTNRQRFDDIVSRHLEPALLADTAARLSAVPGVEVRQNVVWDRGEIDLLAYHGESNTAFQVQAKAAVPPQGARMVGQIESRTLEAAAQVRRFLDLRDEEKDRVCSSALGRTVSAVTWRSGVLVRTCLGTEKAWSGIRGYVPLNPVLLRTALKRLKGVGEFSFAGIDTVVSEELDALRAAAVVSWENKSFRLFGKTIELPLLDLNYGAISAFRDRAFV